MEVNKISYSPNFKAKMLIIDDRVEKFIKSSYMADSKSTFDVLDKFSSIYPDSVVSVCIKNIKDKDYLFVKNGITGKSEKSLVGDAEVLKLETRTSFIDLIKKVMAKKSFWNKMSANKDFDASAIPQNIEHDVFKLD